MIRKLADRWVTFMIKNGAPAEQREVYLYGLECTLNELAGDVILMVAAIVIGRVWEMLLWILVFNLLRLNTGGYHAATPFRCITLSTLLGITCTLVYPLAEGRYAVSGVLAGLCLVIIYLLAPVANEKRPLTEERKNKARKLARWFSAAVFGMIIILMVGSFYKPAALLVVTLCSVAFLALTGSLHNFVKNKAIHE